MTGEKTLESLKQILVDNSYTAIICGFGVMEGGGILGLKQEGRAYEIEQKYSESSEELFHISCLPGKPERPYELYHEEMLKKTPNMTPSVRALTRMEEGDKLQCTATTNIFDLPEQVGCRNVIYLHGGIHENRCLHYSRLCSVEEIKDFGHVPHYKNCGTMVRPDTSLCGEVVSGGIMSRITGGTAGTDVLLILGANLRSGAYSSYIRYFQSGEMVIIHRIPGPLDKKADTVIYDLPQSVLPLLMDGEI